MIPKIIHYCWFGGKPLPPLAQKCLASWKKYCPDCQIMCWNETNFDINFRQYTKEAYQAKKFAFITDVARLWALVNYGGIYMDTDVEVLTPLDSILTYQAVSGFENDTSIPTGLMACEKGFNLFQELLSEYDHIPFVLPNGTYDTISNVQRITRTCVKKGLQLNNTKQTIEGFTLLPKDYLCPKSYVTGKIHLTPNTLTIHHFSGSWLSVPARIKLKSHKLLRQIAGERITFFVQGIWRKIIPLGKRNQ